MSQELKNLGNKKNIEFRTKRRKIFGGEVEKRKNLKIQAVVIRVKLE